MKETLHGDVSTALDMTEREDEMTVWSVKGLYPMFLWYPVRKNGIFTDDAHHFDHSVRNAGCFTDGILVQGNGVGEKKNGVQK